MCLGRHGTADNAQVIDTSWMQARAQWRHASCSLWPLLYIAVRWETVATTCCSAMELAPEALPDRMGVLEMAVMKEGMT